MSFHCQELFRQTRFIIHFKLNFYPFEKSLAAKSLQNKDILDVFLEGTVADSGVGYQADRRLELAASIDSKI